VFDGGDGKGWWRINDDGDDDGLQLFVDDVEFRLKLDDDDRWHSGGFIEGKGGFDRYGRVEGEGWLDREGMLHGKGTFRGRGMVDDDGLLVGDVSDMDGWLGINEGLGLVEDKVIETDVLVNNTTLTWLDNRLAKGLVDWPTDDVERRLGILISSEQNGQL